MRAALWAVASLLLAWTCICVAQDAQTNDPRADMVRAQQADNKAWKDEAIAAESELVSVGNEYLKDKDYGRAAEYFQKALNLSFDQWDIRVLRMGSISSLQPASGKVRCKLSTGNTRVARDRMRSMGTAIEAEQQAAAQKKFESLFEQADATAMLNNPAKAYLIYSQIIDAAASLGEKKWAVQNMMKARDEQKKILAGATKTLDEIDKAVADGKLADAATRLASFKDSNASLVAVAPDLKQRYDRIAGSPGVQREALEAEANQRIQMGDAALLREDYVDAARYYRRAMTKYPDTAASAEAVKKLAQLESDPKASEALKAAEIDAKCGSVIASAQELLASKKFEECKAACQKLIADYPDTTWATQAKGILQNCSLAMKPADNP